VVICRRGERRSEPAVEAGDATRTPYGPRSIWGRAGRELLVVALMFSAYKLGRVVAAKHVGEAFDNAYVIWDLERILRLPDELSLQALMLNSTLLTRAANVYYAGVHFPATAMFLVWLFLRQPANYLWVRRSLALLTAAGLVLHLALPVAPPRMLGRLGFVDTAAVYGPAVYGPPGQNSLADQYAAMPSLHVGWAIVVALGIILTCRSRWRWIALAHPVLTSLVVVATANHFWLDGLAAAGLLGLSVLAVRAVPAWWLGRRQDAGPDAVLTTVPATVPDMGALPTAPVEAGPARVKPLAQALPGLPDRMPPPVRSGRRMVLPETGRSGSGAEDLADVAGDRGDR
jgi:hypothetical protein